MSNLTPHPRLAEHMLRDIKPFPNVKYVIAIASGKGGVGKSTTAVNVALALQAEGLRVGLLDADIYGPNQPMMLGIKPGTKPTSPDAKHLEPIMAHGLQTMSMGYLIDGDSPVIWRGPMITKALHQLSHETLWNVDILVIDLPPGTGDIQLSLVQNIPLDAAIIVTTPQDIALQDAKKGLLMFQKVNIPILGIIENMSFHKCSACGHHEFIFGEAGGQAISDQYGVDLLGQLPLDRRIREQADGGVPIVVAEPESLIAKAYHDIACKIKKGLEL